MKSMTGFGQSALPIEGGSIEVSIRTVNGRFLEIRPHLPKKFIPLEAEILKILKKYISRGTCDIYIQRQMSGEKSELSFRAAVAKKWLSEFRKTLKELKLPDTISAHDLLTIPDFIQFQESADVGEKEKKKLLEVVKTAAGACAQERQREGDSLRKVCLQHLQALKSQIEILRGQREAHMMDAPEKIKEKLQKILGAHAVDSARLIQEVAILAERSDIEEELNRLSEHIKNVETLIKDKQSQGKKLDFYAQELLREVNTIGSKSSSAKIVETVVTSKNLIEQLREQIQNIE